jgi:hypothetical protein
MEHIITMKSGVISVYFDKQALMKYVSQLIAEGTHFTYTTLEA